MQNPDSGVEVRRNGACHRRRTRRARQRLADQRQEPDLGGLQLFLRFLGTDLRGEQPLANLLAVGLGERPGRDQLADLAGDALVETFVLMRFLDDLHLQHVFKIFANDLERDSLGTLQHPEGGAVHAGGLAFEFSASSPAVEQFLRDADADIRRVELVVLDPAETARRAVETPHADRRFQIDTGKIQAAGLAKLEFDRLAILHRLSDLRVGFEGDGNRLAQSQRAGGACQRGCNEQAGGEPGRDR